MNNYAPLTTYIIIIQGRLKEQWADWLNSMVINIENYDDIPIRTAITVGVPDQAALRGIMNKLWDLNLKLIAVNLRSLEFEQTAQGESHENEI